MRSALFLAAVAVVLATGFTTARADGVPAALRACGDEKDDTQRLACFDRELARASQSTTAAPTAPVVPVAPPAPQLTPEERFGRVGAVARDEGKREEKAQEPAIRELTATVVSLSQRSYGEIVMTLDNGQVWAQPSFDSHFSIRVQEKVTIKAGVLRSYIAIAPNGRTTKIVRIR